MSNFVSRHNGVNSASEAAMLQQLGFNSLAEFISKVIPDSLLAKTDYSLAEGVDEVVALELLNKLSKQNKQYKNLIGMGYSEAILPTMIKRNVLENPAWYTAYTPYQAEVSQGRLEVLLNFQQIILDLTGLAVANASLLDEATAVAEAIAMAQRQNGNSNKVLVDSNILPQTLDVVKTRAKYMGIQICVANIQTEIANIDDYFALVIQNPDVYGNMRDYTDYISEMRLANPSLQVIMACDVMSLVLFKSPAAQGADIAVGSTQRFGIPLGFGGPHAAYMAVRDEYKRIMPGRIIGVSVDSKGNKALRLSLQTREQHIRREKATSNICTSQVLLANMAALYVIYHGKTGLLNIAKDIHTKALLLRAEIAKYTGLVLNNDYIFDTIELKHNQDVYNKLQQEGYLLGLYNSKMLLNVGESITLVDIANILHCFEINLTQDEVNNKYTHVVMDNKLLRHDNILSLDVFNTYQSETQMMRYIKYLENKDISLVHTMIPLGSCTMKLNAASELEALANPAWGNIHPFAPKDVASGYHALIADLTHKLCAITGFDDVSFQSNSGAQGEYSGILAIRRYQESIGQGSRNICLIPRSAHGTNPATAQMMGLEVVVVNCDESGNVDVNDLQAKAIQYRDSLSCIMITYPSTHGVFESSIKQICQIIHDNGGQVYMDGANLNALVGLVKPAELGADVSHMNLHKTFAIPHGGGGPGMGPIGVRKHLIDFLPRHGNDTQITDNYAVNSAPYGSALILTISWMYITMMGLDGLQQATKYAILNANYIASALSPYYKILYTADNGSVAHECIIDLRPLKVSSGITEVDVAKRLIDYGFHAPTMSFPVAGTLMVEPTESEDKGELDRFIQAMISIYHEIKSVEAGILDKLNNPLKNSPHTYVDILNWDKPYSIEVGCFPYHYSKKYKFFPSVNRIDDVYGDRNFICNCQGFFDK